MECVDFLYRITSSGGVGERCATYLETVQGSKVYYPLQVLHSGFHSRQAAKYRDIQSLESKVAMNQILDDPKNYERHLQR